jgi:hypothetical protein
MDRIAFGRGLGSAEKDLFVVAPALAAGSEDSKRTKGRHRSQVKMIEWMNRNDN